MDKQVLSYYPETNSGLLQLINPQVLEKTAGVAEDIMNFLQNLIPDESKTYALINALSAGERWGSNLNGDWFDEAELDKHHKSFESLGHVYELHQNKDPEKSIGKVLYSYYNPNMKRVELVVALDNNKASKVLDKAKAGEPLATSMGTRVSYEQCSICGNISKTLSQRCTHLKNEMNTIYSDGRKVFARNYVPKFFDISMVRVPADKTSRVVRMIRIGTEPNDQNKKLIIFEKKLDSNIENSYNKVASFEVNAEISKEIPAKIESIDSSTSLKHIAALVKQRLDADVLYKLSEYPLSDTLSTLLSLGIMPGPEDFQKLALNALGENELAEQLEKDNILFDLEVPDKILVIDDLKLENANEKIATLLADEIPTSSNLDLWKLARSLEKVAGYDETGRWMPDRPKPERSLIGKVLTSTEDEPNISPVKNPIVPLGILGSLYYGYSKVFHNTSPEVFKGFLSKYPWLLPIVVGGAAIASTTAQEYSFNKEAGMNQTFKSGLISFPVAYYMSGKAENEARSGEEITAIQNFVRKHPTLTGILGTIAGNKLQKLMKNKSILSNATKNAGTIKIAELLLQTNEKVLNEIKKDLMEIN